MSKKVIVIGSGFAGLSAACHLAKAGYSVQLLEKNDCAGGRARKMEVQGYHFDMGPSWYWMPEVFEQFFEQFGKKVSDYYELKRLDPAYKIVFGEGEELAVPADMQALKELFESYEPGSSAKLQQFLDEAEYKYKVGMGEFVQKPSLSILEFADLRVVRALFKLQMFSSIATHVEKLFKHPHLRELLKFPVLFLGATPEETPAMYSLMNYADLALGTWFPMGGMYQIVAAMVSLAEELGVEILLNEEVLSIEVSGKQAKAAITKNGRFEADIIVAGADYHHVDQKLLAPEYRNYNERYWDKRVMAPSSLLFYLGVNKPLDNLLHHNLFFDEDFKLHAQEIYKTPKWPSKPLFYACLASKTDPSCAPEGHENLFLLVPVAPELEDTEATREHYYNLVMDRLEALTGQEIRSAVDYKLSYAHKDFKKDYYAYKGNAYGLANTLSQTAFLKPRLKNKKLNNFYYAGQLTTPGPGVPPSLISGEVVAREIIKSKG
ncbi:phytoene desaturase family protein [Saprospira grandis]|uniref:phytoene desaturase family protein n=1 Tax=Saprospira grandis TaxID=1008 RepID=UPI0022DD0F6E|nr:phytoene desaturase family protein [Saprospira grandis]WBM73648.1 phytoene desaturase family protein [Saprospira grandis]